MRQTTLAMKIIKFLGNTSPNEEQIELVESMLSNIGLLVEKIYDERLSLRERHCLDLLIMGKTSIESAKILNISKKTVEQYNYKIKKKFKCKNMAQAAVQGIKYRCLQSKINN